MIFGIVKSSELGKAKFPGALKGSWAPKDNLVECFIYTTNKNIEEANRRKDKWERCTRLYKSYVAKEKASIIEMENQIKSVK